MHVVETILRCVSHGQQWHRSHHFVWWECQCLVPGDRNETVGSCPNHGARCQKRQQLPEWLQKLKWPSQSEKDGLHTGCGSWGSGRTKPKGLMANTARPRAVLKNQEKDSQKESRTEWEGSLWGWKYARNQEKCIWPQHHQSHVAWAQSARCRCICTSPSIWHRRRVQDEAWQRKGQNMARHSWRWSTLHRSDVFRHCFQMVSECFWWLHMDTYGYFIIIIYIYIYHFNVFQPFYRGLQLTTILQDMYIYNHIYIFRYIHTYIHACIHT